MYLIKPLIMLLKDFIVSALGAVFCNKYEFIFV